MKAAGSKERKRARADEARRIVARLTSPSATLSGRELAFVLSVGRKLKRADYVSGRQLAWLRGLELRNWGVEELDRATAE